MNKEEEKNDGTLLEFSSGALPEGFNIDDIPGELCGYKLDLCPESSMWNCTIESSHLWGDEDMDLFSATVRVQGDERHVFDAIGKDEDKVKFLEIMMPLLERLNKDKTSSDDGFEIFDDAFYPI